MINKRYIHEYAPCDQFIYESHYIMCDIEDLAQELNSLQTDAEERMYFGESVDMEYMEAESTNIFTRIGEAIISLWKSFVEMIKTMKTDIKESLMGIKKKGSGEMYRNAMQNDPELAQKFLNGVMSGNIKANDIKDLDELVEQATKINNQFATGKIDKTNYAKKIDNAIANFANTAKNIGSIVGLVAIPATLASNINGIKNFKKIANKQFKESVNIFNEGVDTAGVINKLTSFIAKHTTALDRSIDKLEASKNLALSKVKAGNAGDANIIMNGTRKVMAAIGKEYNTMKNLSSKINSKM